MGCLRHQSMILSVFSAFLSWVWYLCCWCVFGMFCCCRFSFLLGVGLFLWGFFRLTRPGPGRQRVSLRPRRVGLVGWVLLVMVIPFKALFLGRGEI